MKYDIRHTICEIRHSRPGIVLLVTLVLLVVLSTLAYTLSIRLAAQRHRSRFIIDYQTARYGCDSAAKYALVILADINPSLVDRSDEPDFSDLFALSEAEYEELLATRTAEDTYDRATDFNGTSDVNDANDANDPSGAADFNDPNILTIRGPYGPAWPFVTEPVEFEIGSAAVRIEIEDENAKYPLGWTVLADEKVQRETQAGFKTFCEWMELTGEQIDSLKQQLNEIGEIKPFKLNFKPITVIEQKKVATRSRRGRRTTRTKKTQKTVAPHTVHLADFARLFHSSLIDTKLLARPTIISESRKESPLKYMGVWGSSKVNINTAPRQVLEAAFTFGGDADKITEEIIQRRRQKTFTNIKDLKKALFSYSDSIDRCERYITTASSFFTIKVTAVSGLAKATTVIAVMKDGKKIQPIATINSI